MSNPALYCTRCGRRYRIGAVPVGAQLHCSACGARLAGDDERPPLRDADPFRRRTIAGARLRKRLAVRPTHSVYRADYRPLRTTARVEVFTAEFAARHASCLEDHFRAAAATRGLRSTRVASVLDIGRRSDCWFIIQEWTPSDLRALIDEKAPLSVNRVIEVLEGVLTGLAAVDQAGLVHGNVTPEGILLAVDGSPVLDHLSAPARPEDLDRLTLGPAGRPSGRVFYMAPETAGGRPGDVRSDLYSLGAVAFEMLTGRPPYAGRTAAEVAAAHRAGPAPDALVLRPDVPEAVAAFVHRLMARDPAERPATPAQALEELRKLAVDLSRRRRIVPVAGALTPSERTRSAVRWTVAWTLVTLLLFALAIVPGTLMCRRRGRVAPRRMAHGTGRVLLTVGRGDTELPPGDAEAVLQLMRHALAYFPALEGVDPGAVQEVAGDGRTPEDAARALDAEYVLTAHPAAGLGRRRWMVVLQRPAGEPWMAWRETAVEDGAPDGWASLERAVGEVLADAAARRNPDAPAPTPAVTEADAEGWRRLGAALEAERAGRWADAADHADAAARRAARPGPFALLAAFYRAAAAAGETGRFAPLPEPARHDLPPHLAALADVLDAVAGDDEAATEQAFADYLAGFPRSARGYWLLGLWRLKAQGRAEEALVAFRHALALDPGYAPPAQGSEEALQAGGQ
ncbi:MAG: serine/threonine protein kinase [Candidatus Brocadiaceae bacterium]|nr:serine/threonine protein kinase [Candidatus Brocadiaceae bacterium]